MVGGREIRKPAHDPRERTPGGEVAPGSGGAVAIRGARSEDHDAILALWLALIEHHRALAPAFPPAPGIREVLSGEIRRGTERQRCRLLVAERGSATVGFLFAEVDAAGAPADPPPAGWIHELYVAPELRRRGIAGALVAEADAFFRARGVQRVSVRVESGNADALRYWRERGFGERARILERLT